MHGYVSVELYELCLYFNARFVIATFLRLKLIMFLYIRVTVLLLLWRETEPLVEYR